jgi:hypothetical protein
MRQSEPTPELNRIVVALERLFGDHPVVFRRAKGDGNGLSSPMVEETLQKCQVCVGNLFELSEAFFAYRRTGVMTASFQKRLDEALKILSDRFPDLQFRRTESAGDFSGRENTIDVFGVAVCDQKETFRRLLPVRNGLAETHGVRLFFVLRNPDVVPADLR